MKRVVVCFVCAVVGFSWAQYEGDYREILEDAINGVNAEISAAGAAVGNNDAASARTHLSNAVNLMKQGAWWSQAIRETKLQYPAWDAPTINTMPSSLNAGIYFVQQDVIAQKLADAQKKFELAQFYAGDAQIKTAVAVMATGVTVFWDAWGLATATAPLDVAAQYATGDDMKSMVQSVQQRLLNLEQNFETVGNLVAAKRELQSIYEDLQVALSNARKAPSVLEQMNGDLETLRRFVAYRRLTTAQLDPIRFPPEDDDMPLWDSSEFVSAINEVVADFNAGELEWVAAESIAAQIHNNAVATYSGGNESEWNLFADAYGLYTDLKNQRTADYAELIARRDDLQSALSQIQSGLNAITLPPSGLSTIDASAVVADLKNSRSCTYDLPWMDRITYNYGIPTELGEFDWAVRQERINGGDSLARPDFLEGISGVNGYYTDLWNNIAQYYASACRAVQANRDGGEWFAIPSYRNATLPYGTAILTEDSLRACLGNLDACQDEADSFASDFASAAAEAAGIAAALPDVESKIAAIQAWMDAHPVTLPSAEMAGGLTVTSFTGNTFAWGSIGLIDIDIDWLENGIPLAASIAAMSADSFEDRCGIPEQIIEDDLAFNQNLRNQSEKWEHAAQTVFSLRGDWQGMGYPGGLYDALDHMDVYITACLDPENHSVSMGGEVMTFPQLVEQLRFYMGYIESLSSDDLRSFADTIEEIRSLTNELLAYHYTYISAATWLWSVWDAYEDDPVEGRIVFEDNIPLVNRVTSARWSVERQNPSEKLGMLTMGEIRLGLPKLRSWLSAQDVVIAANGDDPYVSYSVLQGFTSTLNIGSWAGNWLTVFVEDQNDQRAEGVMVTCEYQTGDETNEVSSVSDADGVCRFVLTDSLQPGNIWFTFRIGDQEKFSYGAVVSADSDGDGISDDVETSLGMIATNSFDATMDSDGDGITDIDELAVGTDPNNADTDGDGTDDGTELAQGTSLTDPTMQLLSGEAQISSDYLVIPVDWMDIPTFDLPFATNDDAAIVGQVAGLARHWVFVREYWPGANGHDNSPEIQCGWTEEGSDWTFDGCDFDPFGTELFVWQDSLMSLGDELMQSTNGCEWTLLSDVTPWAGVQSEAVVKDNVLYVTSGSELWNTTNGIDWVQVATNLTFLTNRLHCCFTEVDDCLAIGSGYDPAIGIDDWDAGFDDIWISADNGVSWTNELFMPDSIAPFIRARHLQLAGTDYFYLTRWVSQLIGPQTDLYTYDSSRTFPWLKVKESAEGEDAVLFRGELYSIEKKYDYYGINWAMQARYSGNRLRGLPYENRAGFARAQHLAVGRGCYAAISRDGTLWTWGENRDGQLGQGDTQERMVPTQVGTNGNWVSVSAGDDFFAAINCNGDLYTWGDNFAGVLGVGDEDDRLVPTLVAPTGVWQTVVCGSAHMLARQADNTLWTWGYNWENSLGFDGAESKYLTPQPLLLTVPDSTNQFVAASGKIAAWATRGLVTGSDGIAGDEVTLTWGSGSSVQEWSGITNWIACSSGVFLFEDGTSSRQAELPYTRWISMVVSDSSGNGKGAGVCADNSLWCWASYSNTPVRISSDSDWIAVQGETAYGDYLLAQKADGSLWLSENGGELQPVPVFGADAVADADRDGLPDWYESRSSSLDAETMADGDSEYDGDMLTALEEYQLGTDSDNDDTDGDGLPDGWEAAYSDPLSAPAPPTSGGGGISDVGSWAPSEPGPWYMTVGAVDDYAFIADDSVLELIDISTPSSPVHVGSFPNLGSTCRVEVDGNYAYAARGWQGLAVLDISALPAITVVTNIDSVYAYGMCRIGDRLFLSDSGVVCLDISNPAAPVSVNIGSIDGGDVATDGTLLYAATDFGLKVYTTNGVQVGASGGNGVYRIALGSGFVYGVSQSADFSVFDISDPSAVSLLSTTNLQCGVSGIAAERTTAYVACYDQGVKILEASNPQAVTLAESVSHFAMDACFDSGTLYICAGDQGLKIVSAGVSDPDEDDDGMEDAWEMEHFGSLTNAPDDDFDGDGLSNFAELAAGLDPTDDDEDDDGIKDGDEVFIYLIDPTGSDTDGDGVPDGHELIIGTSPSVESAPYRMNPAAMTANGFELSIPALAGREYIVEYKESLDDSTWNELTRRDGADGTLAVEDPEAVEGRFYRVRVRMK